MDSIKSELVEHSENLNPEKPWGIRFMFWDEAGFGRISDPAACWSPPKVRPLVGSHRIREYVYLYGAVDPNDGENFFMSLPKSDKKCTEIFLDGLSKAFPDDYLILCGDNAPWHHAKELIVPENIELIFIPAYTPEMNPIEQIWSHLRKVGFKNRQFESLKKVVDKLEEVVGELMPETIVSITNRDWVPVSF